MKRKFSKIVAVFCAVVMIVNTIGIQIFAETSTASASLTELTFSNFGLDDDTYSTQVLGTYNNAATLVGTQISGYVTLNEDLKNAVGDAWLSFGYNTWGGLQLLFKPDGSLHVNTSSTAKTNPCNYVIDPANISSLNGKNFCGTKFKLTLSLEAANLDSDGKTDDVLLKLYINDEVAVANPTGDDELYGSNGEYYILDAEMTQLQGYLITQQIGLGSGYCSDITLGSVSGELEPEEPAELTELTFSNFGLENKTYTNVSGIYNEGTTLIGTKFSGYITFNEDLTSAIGETYVVFGGTTGQPASGWDGVQLLFDPDGKTIKLNQGSVTDTNPYQYTFSADTNEGLTTFAGERFKLAVSFESANLDNGTTQNDILVKLYINDNLWVASDTGNAELYGENGSYYILNAKTENMQGYLAVQMIGTEGFCSDIGIESIASGTPEPGPGPAPEEPAELTELTFIDFNLADNRYTSVKGTYNEGESLVGKQVSGYLTFNEDLTSAIGETYVVFGGTTGQPASGWDGIQLVFDTDGKTLYLNQGSASDTNPYQYTYRVDSNEGVTTFAGEKVKVKVTFAPANLDGGTEENDVIVRLYMNDNLWVPDATGNEALYGKDGAIYILNAKTDNLQGYLAVQQIGAEGFCSDIVLESLDGKGKETIEKPVLHKVTLGQLGITAALYQYNNNDLVTSGIYRDTLMNSVFSTKITFSVHDNNRMMYGGKPSAWHGINFSALQNGEIKIHAGDGEFPEIYRLKPEVAGTDLVGEEIDFKIELFKSGNNAKLGVYINGELYDGSYFHLTGAAEAFGNFVGFYVEDEKGSIKIGVPEPTPVVNKDFKQLTFDSYDIETGTYSYDVLGLATSGHCDLESLDKVVFSDTVQFSKATGTSLRIGGKPSAWHGLVFNNTADGKLMLNEATGKMPTIYFDPATAGTALVGKDIKLQLSFEYVDSDEDGKKDDVKLGVWFNGKAYGDRWLYLQDIAEVLGGYLGIYCANEDAYLKVYTYHVPIDYTIWGFTKRWAYELGLRKE